MSNFNISNTQTNLHFFFSFFNSFIYFKLNCILTGHHRSSSNYKILLYFDAQSRLADRHERLLGSAFHFATASPESPRCHYTDVPSRLTKVIFFSPSANTRTLSCRTDFSKQSVIQTVLVYTFLRKPCLYNAYDIIVFF